MCAINNALDACSAQKEPQVVISGTCKDSSALLCIRDNGTGMDFITQHLAFIRGLTTKRHGQGIGLYFVQEVIEHIHQGKVQLESTPGSGTVMTWHLPLAIGTQTLELSRSSVRNAPAPFATA